MWAKIAQCRRQRRGTIFVVRSVEEQITIITATECTRNQLHATWPPRRRESFAQLFVAHRGDTGIAECVDCRGCDRGIGSLMSTEQTDAHRTAPIEFHLNAVASE
jgi:hypothetical protein